MTEAISAAFWLHSMNGPYCLSFSSDRIKTNDGHVWGKGIGSKDLELGEMAPVPEETEKPKRGRKKADEAAPEAEQNEPENAPAEE